MPGAPAATQTSTASSTFGTRPPREFRNVATLLTLTLKRTMPAPVSFRPDLLAHSTRSTHATLFTSLLPPSISPEVFLHRVHNLLRPGPDLLLILALEHHAEQRLSPRVAHEQAALPGHARLDAGNRVGHGGHGPQFGFLADSNIEEHLRIGREIACELRQRPSRQRNGSQHIQRRAEAVTREQIVGEDDVPRLLSPERQAPPQHFFHHVLVADGAANELDAERFQRNLESDVA